MSRSHRMEPVSDGPVMPEHEDFTRVVRDLDTALDKLVRAEAQARSYRDQAELLLYALVELLPVEGSMTHGFKVRESFQTTVTATPEEWATAAMHFCELHAALRSGDS